MTIIQALNLITFILYSILYQALILSYALPIHPKQYHFYYYQILSSVFSSYHLEL
jgi:hypothetical protein